jgi:hypothetical protein
VAKNPTSDTASNQQERHSQLNPAIEPVVAAPYGLNLSDTEPISQNMPEKALPARPVDGLNECEQNNKNVDTARFNMSQRFRQP